MASIVAQHNRPPPPETPLTRRTGPTKEVTGKAGQTSGLATPTIAKPPPNKIRRSSPHTTRCIGGSLLNIVERSITADRLIEELQACFAVAGGPPLVLRMDNEPELISQALQSFCAGQVGLCYIPPGTPWNNGYIESFNNRLRRECLNRNHWTSLTEARVVIGDFKHEHNHRHRHGYLNDVPPAEFEAAFYATKRTDQTLVEIR